MRRDSQLSQIEEAIQTLEAYSSDLKQRDQTLDLLQSVSAGLYEEIDKLAKKSPVDQISSLVLGQVNDVIRESKELAADDPFMKRYAEFVAAGDNPEHRDVVVVLRQIRQGLDRFAEALPSTREQADELLSDAYGIQMALQIFQEGDEEVTLSHLEANDVSISDHWKTGSYGNFVFDFDVLDRTDILNYFKRPG